MLKIQLSTNPDGEYIKGFSLVVDENPGEFNLLDEKGERIMTVQKDEITEIASE